jgi:hypothetical protein
MHSRNGRDVAIFPFCDDFHNITISLNDSHQIISG